MCRSSHGRVDLSRRSVLKGTSRVAVGAFVAVCAGPFVRKAEAATHTLRLLMRQSHAIKELIAEFEAKLKAKITPTFFDGNAEVFSKLKVHSTKHFDIVMADGF